ncbi:TauD/TfdA family dioxygenase [Agrobacterium vitis]|uniref:TauD/TfdA family dioxygenase n=2 Tax=Agrobacterium vitis TaxID=373 RepID=A0AAE2URA7_AGRVI|nr:TauD/TfdA family dioxygenase [Agrobacterium vitis]MBF2714318.1 TauD/TfdA family dioxygenase [Agrobacterium vitis]
MPALRAFVSALGLSTMRIDKLHPREAMAARPNSLSANHGKGRFPPHTDFAFLPLPPRYIALFCPVSRPGATTLFSGDRLRAAATDSGTFRITTSAKSYFASFANISRHGKFYRYNSDLMKPLDPKARRLSEVISDAQPDHFVDWEKISWVIFDNWGMLHGRQAMSETTGWLWRLALEKHA